MNPWKERLIFGALAIAFLIPIAILQGGIDRDSVMVVFLRWIENQEAREGQVLQKIVLGEDERTPEEIAFYDRVEEVGASLSPDFRELSIPERWRVFNSPDFEPLYERFIQLVRQSRITLAEGEIEWANPDVSANVGALVLGFRKLVADMLWLKVDEYWHLGLIQRMLPMMETVVTLDPHFIEAYALGAWHLAYNVTVTFRSKEKKLEYIYKGVHFLEKGIKGNPRSAKLYAELGFTMYFRKLLDWEKAAYYLGEATKYEHEAWHERAYAISLERMGEEEKALAVLENYGLKYPDYRMHKSTMARLQKKLEARRLEEEGKLEEAARIWTFLKEDDPSDVVAPKEAFRFEQMLSTADDVSS